jgi:predicted RNA binding protein YcfA (HicA-like mRNA interferase family)
LAKLGYQKISQKGSHIKLETMKSGKHRVVITTASPIPIGTLSDILSSIARHFNLSIQELIDSLDL